MEGLVGVVNRNALPRWLNSMVDSIADSPTSLLGRVAARRLGAPAPRGTVASTRFDHRPRRVLIAPVNYSAQGVAWAHALEAADPGISARNMAVDVPGGFSFDADLVVPVGTYHNDPDWHRRQFEAATHATHVLIEAEEPPFGRLLGRSVAAQSGALRERGVDVAYIAHGTDVRLPSQHIADHPLSYFTDPSVYAPRAQVRAARNIALLLESGRPLFVSTPDLLDYVPGATWCPVVVDPGRWAVDRAPRDTSAPLRVAHAPSVGAVKGTQFIMPTLERLTAAGLIELEVITGVPSAEMPAAFARADVVVDQFRVGSYGVAACEAMAAGCVVVGDITAAVRAEVGSDTGFDLPIVDSDVTGLEDVLIALTCDEGFDRRREAGRSFVRAVHDGRASARALIDQWIDPLVATEQEVPVRASDR